MCHYFVQSQLIDFRTTHQNEIIKSLPLEKWSDLRSNHAENDRIDFAGNRLPKICLTVYLDTKRTKVSDNSVFKDDLI